MKRDMDLVRKILLAIEASERPLDSTLIRIGGFTHDNLTEHMRLMHEAGLIEGIAAYSIEHKLKWVELRLTWSGHDFIDAARNEAVWSEALGTVRTQIGTVAFAVLKDVLMDVSRSILGVESEVVLTKAEPVRDAAPQRPRGLPGFRSNAAA
jgi:hypothetical protein